MQDVVAERQFGSGGWSGAAMVKVEDFLQQQVVAFAVQDQRIDAEVQAPVVG